MVSVPRISGRVSDTDHAGLGAGDKEAPRAGHMLPVTPMHHPVNRILEAILLALEVDVKSGTQLSQGIAEEF
jgi:hypothetical protein